MSCYEWERGTIVIPSDQWAGFKKQLRETYNSGLQKQYLRACEIHTKLVAVREKDKATPWERLFQKTFGKPVYNIQGRSLGYEEVPEEDLLLFYRCLLPWEGRTMKRSQTLKRPLKKDFAPANSSTKGLNDDEGKCGVTFDDKTRTVTWDVMDNNHACEWARNSSLGRAFFAALKQVLWTHGSGGTIVGNDEYNRESHSAGAGGNYIKDSFGPRGDTEQGWAGQFRTQSAFEKYGRTTTKRRK